MRAAQLVTFVISGLCALALVFVPVLSAQAASFEDAATAYKNGDYTSAMRIWRTLGEAGDVRAIYNLGVLFDLGQGVTPDPAQAAVYFQHAAQAGHVRAMSNYGRMLE
ncbi:MAG: hypothetical protein FWG59_04855, partial [Betaproteobacteria bacterium]|nr:hypothetical protein [Betaproteobacteria bacterium]